MGQCYTCSCNRKQPGLADHINAQDISSISDAYSVVGAFRIENNVVSIRNSTVSIVSNYSYYITGGYSNYTGFGQVAPVNNNTVVIDHSSITGDDVIVAGAKVDGSDAGGTIIRLTIPLSLEMVWK